MPLTTTITEDRTIKREQLAFDVAGGATYSSGIGGGGVSGGAQGPIGPQGTQGVQGAIGSQGSTGPQGDTGSQGSTGPQGDIGATGPQGPQGVDGAGLSFPAGSQGRVVYVASDLSATTSQYLTYDETTGKGTIETTPTGNNYALSVVNGAQGIKTVQANVLEIKADEQLGGSPGVNHGIVVDYNSQKEFGIPTTFAKQVVGFDGSSIQRTQVSFVVYDFQTSTSAETTHHTRYDNRTLYHTGSTGLSNIGFVKLFTNNVTTAPSDTFGGKVQYQLQQGSTIGSEATAVSHEYLWKSVANGQGQYNLEVKDTTLGGTNEFNSIEATTRNTKILGWTTSTNSITNALTVENNHATSGTMSTNSGTNITLLNRSSNTNSRELGALEGYWSTATDASRVGEIRLRATDSVSSTGFEMTKYNTGVVTSSTGLRLSPYDSATGTNTSFILTPKGTGGLILGTSAAGSSARGQNVIDMSFTRGAGNVAIGNFTTIMGGGNNTMTSGGTYGGIFAGQNNSVSANNAVIAGGDSNSATGVNSFAIGKKAQTIVPNSFAIASGENTASAFDSVGIQFVLRNSVSGSGTVDLLNDGNTLLQRDTSFWIINALIVGRGSALNYNVAYRLIGAHRRETGTTGALVGTPAVPADETFTQGGTPTAPTIVSVNGHPVLRVTGIAGITMKFVAYVSVTQVFY